MNKIEKDAAQFKQKMIFDALIIIRSVEWIEKQIALSVEKGLKAKKAGDTKTLAIIESEIKSLCRKLQREDDNMSSYMSKYKELINEKEKMLHNHGRKK